MRKREFHFYVDDSGSAHPDRHPRAGSDEPDWFAYGGVMVDADDKDAVEGLVDSFKDKWPQLQGAALRSYDIRNKSGAYRWLATCEQGEAQRFYEGISQLVREARIVVNACVVHRPGYNERYLEKYGPRRWKLCRTAFNIAVERAAKFAIHHDARLRVFVERCGREPEERLKGYYESLRSSGPPFSAETSAQYDPLSAAQLKQTLFEFGVRTKESRVMQLADLTLWPVCKGGYDPAHRSYAVLREDGKLIDCYCTADNRLHGIKYSCFPRA